MIGEIVVFGSQQGVDEVLGDVIETDRRSPHLAKFGDQLVIAAVDPEWDLQLDAAQGLDGWEAGAKIKKGAAKTER